MRPTAHADRADRQVARRSRRDLQRRARPDAAARPRQGRYEFRLLGCARRRHDAHRATRGMVNHMTKLPPDVLARLKPIARAYPPGPTQCYECGSLKWTQLYDGRAFIGK